MSKRKGLSAEEKRNRMLQLFYEKKEFFQMKELEKIAPKEKGIVAQSVKDVVQSLVDDDMVDTEKIGTSIYFWAFPSKAKHTRKRQLSDLQEKVELTQKQLKKQRENLNQAQAGREDNPERDDIIVELKKQKELNQQLSLELQKYKDNDPETFEKAKKEIELLKEGINRWTDNIFSLKSWCKNKFNIEESILEKQFGIPSDMDYID
uniref:Meiotic nuclear division protein 1 homolog n=1 Tax=Panstrongylus lignarius TaxID=156445 RepID=A0A224XKI8_9HEMI